MDKESEYIFPYSIEGKEDQRDPLTEMIRAQLETLLNLRSLYHKGEPVRADGFRLMNEREIVHPIFSAEPDAGGQQTQGSGQDDKPPFPTIANAELYEPRITHIKEVLESLLAVVELEANGRAVKIDGFRLKNLNHWVVPSAGDPAEVFDHLATRCDCHCSFCYLKGNPPTLALQQLSRTAEEEYEESRTRLNYFSPHAKHALFPTLGSSYEIFSHPYALDLLPDLRQT